MQIHSLGRIDCGPSIVPLADSPLRIRVSRVFVSAVSGMTGRMFLGTEALDKATLAGVLKEFAVPEADAGLLESFEVVGSGIANDIDLSALFIDGTVSGEGLIVSYVQI